MAVVAASFALVIGGGDPAQATVNTGWHDIHNRAFAGCIDNTTDNPPKVQIWSCVGGDRNDLPEGQRMDIFAVAGDGRTMTNTRPVDSLS